MEFLTKDIIDVIELTLNKTIDNVNSEELLEIKNLTLNQIGYNNSIKEVKKEEILYLPNIEDLTLISFMIDEEFWQIIKSLKKLKKLNIYDSDFVLDLEDSFSSLDLESLTIRNVEGFNVNFINNIKYVEISSTNINFPIRNVETLNLCNNDSNINSLDMESINTLMISERYYNNEIYFKGASKIKIINDQEEVVRVINHD